MYYTFSKPQNDNIIKKTWDTIKVQWLFWFTICLCFISVYFIAIPFVYFMFVLEGVRILFWKEFAQINGWEYKNKYDKFISIQNSPNNESALMFKQGHSQSITNEINGTINNRNFRIFSYNFSVGYGKSRRTYLYTVFCFKHNGSFPHIYLNSLYNEWDAYPGEKIPLPKDFEDKFSLHTPRKYEIEALEIFTPDILMNLIDNDFHYDVEFVNQEILIFTAGQINNFKDLEKNFNKSLELNDLFSKKLDNFKFEKIGDMPNNF